MQILGLTTPRLKKTPGAPFAQDDRLSVRVGRGAVFRYSAALIYPTPSLTAELRSRLETCFGQLHGAGFDEGFDCGQSVEDG